MYQIDSDTLTEIIEDCQKGDNCLSSAKRQRKPQNEPQANTRQLKLMETPRTLFLWNEQEQNVKDTPATLFDAWIRQYVDTIVNVDIETWEIFHRWQVINAVRRGQLLTLRDREDGTLILEEKASTSEAKSEAFSSEAMSNETASEATQEGA